MTTQSILVVEDDALVRSYVCMVLDAAGLSYQSCDTGAVALRTLESSPDSFGLMLLDLTLPDMSGLEVAAKAATIQPRLPVVVMSGHGVEAAREALSQSPIVSFLKKPFLPDALIEEVRRYLPDEGASPTVSS